MIYLCTCGTSANKGWPKDFGRYGNASIEKNGGREAAIRLLTEYLLQYSMSDDEHLSKFLSAEIHSLARMKVGEKDSVVLFVSETLDGQVCAEAVAAYLRAQGLNVRIEIISGLQVGDARRFSRVGVIEYLRRAIRYIDGYGAGQCVLNPTGGFKALVPYSVLLGMLRDVACRYIFEFSTELIELPPLPVDFSRSALESVRPVLEKIARESSISCSRFEVLLDWTRRQELVMLFELEQDEVTLSAVGLLVLEDLQKPAAKTVFLSQEAMRGLSRLRSLSGVNPRGYLERVAGSAGKLASDGHLNAGDGLFWLKPGDTTDRYLVSVEDDWKLLVWEMHDHGEYEVLLKNNQLGRTAREARSRKYAPFFRLDFVD